MNIKEYIKIQAEKCENDTMKNIFIDLVDTFFPKPKEVTVVSNDNLPWQPVAKKITSSNDNFYKRKVRIDKLPDGHASIGLVNSDGYDIKLPKQRVLEWVLCDDQRVIYYYGLNHLFYRDADSRIVKIIDKNNYQKHRANVETIRDYVLKDYEVLEIN